MREANCQQHPINLVVRTTQLWLSQKRRWDDGEKNHRTQPIPSNVSQQHCISTWGQRASTRTSVPAPCFRKRFIHSAMQMQSIECNVNPAKSRIQKILQEIRESLVRFQNVTTNSVKHTGQFSLLTRSLVQNFSFSSKQGFSFLLYRCEVQQCWSRNGCLIQKSTYTQFQHKHFQFYISSIELTPLVFDLVCCSIETQWVKKTKFTIFGCVPRPSVKGKSLFCVFQSGLLRKTESPNYTPVRSYGSTYVV